ncbi:Flavin-containing monooxygenase FMO GS-OX5, partial [Bienertia sinuspersici]
NHFQRWLSNLRKFASLEVGRPGLVAARELRREGHEVVLGGVWAYSPKVESDPLGLDRTRYIIHFVLIFLEREQIHSHNNRTPEPYQDQGHCWTGKEVHIIARSEEVGRFRKYPIYDNTWLHPMVKNSPMRRANNNDVKRAHGDGRVSFKDGSEVKGAHGDGRVSFKDGRWISLPSEEKMMEDIEAFYFELEAKGVLKHYTHRIHGFKLPFGLFEYEDWLVVQSRSPLNEEWRKGISFGALPLFLKLR